MIRFSNESGFLELTTLDQNGSGMTIPTLVRVENIVMMTDISHVDDEYIPSFFKGAKTVIVLDTEEAHLAVHQKMADIVDQIRRP